MSRHPGPRCDSCQRLVGTTSLRCSGTTPPGEPVAYRVVLVYTNEDHAELLLGRWVNRPCNFAWRWADHKYRNAVRNSRGRYGVKVDFREEWPSDPIVTPEAATTA